MVCLLVCQGCPQRAGLQEQWPQQTVQQLLAGGSACKINGPRAHHITLTVALCQLGTQSSLTSHHGGVGKGDGQRKVGAALAARLDNALRGG